MQSNYVLLLDDRLKSLGHFADQILQSPGDYDVFRILCINWVPFVKRVQLLQPLSNVWDEHVQEYHQNWKKTEKEAVNQITMAFVEIKRRLKSRRLLKDQEIADKLTSVEQILSGEERVCLQPHYEIAFDRMKNLLQCLFDKGKKKTLIEMANVVYPTKKDRKINSNAKPYLHSFSFSPAILDLSYLKKMQSRENFHDSWMGWKNFCLAQWCWAHGREYFQRQELTYDSISLSEHSTGNNSIKFLERIGLVKELKSIFIEKTSTYTVKFRGKNIELKSLASVDQAKLIQQIETLPIKR